MARFIISSGIYNLEDNDFVETPYFNYRNSEHPMPGLEVHANAIEQLLDAASNSKLHCLADMIRFASLTLARYSEIVGLRRENVDFNKKTATFMETKTTPSHTIPLHNDAVAILKKYPFGDTFFHVKKFSFEKLFFRNIFSTMMKKISRKCSLKKSSKVVKT